MAVNKTYGKIEFSLTKVEHSISSTTHSVSKKKSSYERAWIITEAQAHVCIKLKNTFPKLDKTGVAPFYFPDLPEVCADLQWFMSRYPLEISKQDIKLLRKGCKKFENHINELEKILMPDYTASQITDLRPGMAGRHYQNIGVDLYLKRRRILIGDDLGLGKTLIAILSFLKPGQTPAAVVCQTHLPPQWAFEIEKFTFLKVHIIKGTKPYSLPKADVYIFKYSLLAGWVDVFATQFFQACVFDEVQEFRTGPGSGKYGGGLILSKSVKNCLMLSATPIYNYADEIYHIYNLLEDGCLGSFNDFTREWGSYDGRRFICKDPKALGSYLRESFLFLRRTRAEVNMELPPVNKIEHYIEYDEDVMEKDMQLAKMLAIKVVHGSFVESGQAARELNALVRHSTGVAKARYVAEYVKTIPFGKRYTCGFSGMAQGGL